jgi:hypothetical protein
VQTRADDQSNHVLLFGRAGVLRQAKQRLCEAGDHPSVEDAADNDLAFAPGQKFGPSGCTSRTPSQFERDEDENV